MFSTRKESKTRAVARGSVLFSLLLSLLLAACSMPGANVLTHFSDFPLPNDHYLGALAAGPDGNLWIMEESSVVRMTPSGTITTFAKPNDDFYGGGYGGYITAGPDGNMWFIGGRPGSPPRLGRFSPNQ